MTVDAGLDVLHPILQDLVDPLGIHHILAGCAGFAAVLPELLQLGSGTPRPIPTLGENFTVICGSVNPITVAQVAYAEQHGFVHKQLEPEQKLSSGYWQTPEGEEMLQTLYRMLEANPHRILDTNDPGSNQKTADYAAKFGMDIQDIRRAVSGTIGYLVSRLFSHEAVGTLLITGGDTLLVIDKLHKRYILESAKLLTSGIPIDVSTLQASSATTPSTLSAT